ncbi:MAG: LapA family protein [Pseudomonadota bacterium]
MRRLSLIITAPLAVIVVVFALTNRQVTEINLWPFGQEIAAPLFALVLGCAFIGFVIGAAVMWVSDGRVRKKRRAAEFRITNLEQELHDARRREANAAKVVSPGGSSLPSTELAKGPQRPAA